VWKIKKIKKIFKKFLNLFFNFKKMEIGKKILAAEISKIKNFEKILVEKN